MRTQQEIIEDYRRSKHDDVLGFRGEVLLPYLTADQVKELFGKPDADFSTWEPNSLEREAVLAEAKEYMIFAWSKVSGHRGISASRSVEKMEAWLWLLSEDELLVNVQRAPYQNYGAPKLALICQHFDWPILDNESIRRMIESQKCCDDCNEGCG